MITFQNKLGHLPNPVDERDFKLGTVQAPIQIPTVYKPDSFFALTALMQGQEPACGGFSLDQLEQYYTYLRTTVHVGLSPRYAYMAEKSLDGIGINTNGTTLRAIGQAATKVGICIDSLVTDDLTLASSVYGDISQASAVAKSDALTRLEQSYFFIDDLSFNGLKQAIYQNKAIILELQVGNEWWTAPNGTASWAAADLLPIRPPAKVVDGHFILAGAYDENYIYVLNSWSPEWAQNGFGYLGSNYLPFIEGALALVDLPPSVKQALTTNQINLANQILEDMKKVLELMKKEI